MTKEVSFEIEYTLLDSEMLDVRFNLTGPTRIKHNVFAGFNQSLHLRK